MKKLEQVINDHREEFDSDLPSEGHFGRFEALLDAQAPISMPARSHRKHLRIAAIILVLISASVMVFDHTTNRVRTMLFSDEQSALTSDLQDAIHYYDNKTAQQLSQITKLATSPTQAAELKNSAINAVRSLDNNTAELSSELKNNPGNEQILTAISRNQRMKDEILSGIIRQLTPTLTN